MKLMCNLQTFSPIKTTVLQAQNQGLHWQVPCASNQGCSAQSHPRDEVERSLRQFQFWLQQAAGLHTFCLVRNSELFFNFWSKRLVGQWTLALRIPCSLVSFEAICSPNIELNISVSSVLCSSIFYFLGCPFFHLSLGSLWEAPTAQ